MQYSQVFRWYHSRRPQGQAYSMLLGRGLVRIGLPLLANAEFDLVAVSDPYGYASAAELALFRRPLPTTNLKFDSAVMWDGREVVLGASVISELQTQASDAVVGQARGRPLTSAQRVSIARFEIELASAQIYDNEARELYDGGAKGGPSEILVQSFYIGINDNFGDSQTWRRSTRTCSRSSIAGTAPRVAMPKPARRSSAVRRCSIPSRWRSREYRGSTTRRRSASR